MTRALRCTGLGLACCFLPPSSRGADAELAAACCLHGDLMACQACGENKATGGQDGRARLSSLPPTPWGLSQAEAGGQDVIGHKPEKETGGCQGRGGGDIWGLLGRVPRGAVSLPASGCSCRITEGVVSILSL